VNFTFSVHAFDVFSLAVLYLQLDCGNLQVARSVAARLQRDKSELKLQKSYLWQQMGKKYTCAAEHNQVKAFIIDSNKDRAN